MALSLRRIAEKNLTLSDLMVDRDKIDTEEIIETFKDGVTLGQIDECVLDEETVYVYTFKENPNVFAFAGHILKNLFKDWISCYGSVEDVNLALSKEKVTLKLEKGKTKDGKREITKVSII